MNLARIDGVVTATVCHPSMRRTRTVICQPLGAEGQDEGPPVLAVDFHGAGLHQRVMITTDGSETRRQVGDPKSPLRNLVLAVLDEATQVEAVQS